jgi:OPT oligopeptide transporter protein
LDQNLYRKTRYLAAGEGDSNEKIGIDMELADDSPYPEVRAAVPNTDDPTVPCVNPRTILTAYLQNTIRMWTIAFIFCTLGSGINMLLSLRRPSIVITSIVAQLLSFPVGKAWGTYMPEWEFTIFGKRIQLNPGPFNIKEHCLIVVCSPD